MAFLFHKPKPQSTKTDKINSIRVSQSVLGQTLPSLFGVQRVHMSLIWYGDFKAIAHTQKQGGGGGMSHLGGGGSTTSTTYTYQAALIGALAQGELFGILNIWDSKGRYTQAYAQENYTVPTGGGSYQVGNHPQFNFDHGVGASTHYHRVVDDFGGDGPTTLDGYYDVPLDPDAGDYTLDPSTGTYTFPAAQAGKVLSITYSYNLVVVSTTEIASIPGPPYQIAVQNNSEWVDNVRVEFSPSGVGLTQVASAPAAGQYSVAAGIYTFNAADITKTVKITYHIKDSNTDETAPTVINFTFFFGELGQAVWGYLASAHPDQALGYSQIAYIASSAMDLGSGASLPNYTFEVVGGYNFGAGIVDCDPSVCIWAVLFDPARGLASNGQNPFPSNAVGDWTQASNFWVANSFFISPLVENQREASATIRDWLEAGMTAAFFSEGKLKLMPYGDVSVAGNGVIYEPATQPIEDLTDDDFVLDNPGDDPIKVTRTPLSEANNRVQVQWANRASAYNPEITQEQDDSAVNRFGVRTEQPQNWDFITTQVAATLAANLRVKRSINIRNTYTFRVSWTHSYLEPMDLVTLTTINDSFFTLLPVRITKIEDDPEKGLTITAEDFPWGTATASLYQKQTAVPYFPVTGLADPGPTSALIIEAPDQLVSNQGHALYIFCSPTNNTDWGGCDVYVSIDGLNYQWFAQVSEPARVGTLGANLAAGTVDPDTHSATMNVLSGTLGSASQVAFDTWATLSALFNANPVAITRVVPLGIDAPYFPNLDFEQSSAIPPSGWIAIYGGVLSYDTSAPFQGTRSVKVDSSALYGGIETDPTYWYPVKPGQQFSATVWVKSNGTDYVYASLQVYSPDKSTYIGALSYYEGTNANTWTKLSMNGSIPTGAGWLLLTVASNVSTPMSFEVDAATISQAGTNIIPFPNLDFEESNAIPPPAWYVGGATATFDTTTPYQGTRSLKLTISTVYGGAGTAAPYWYEVVPGQVLTVNCAVKSDGVHGAYIQLQTYAPDKSTWIGVMAGNSSTSAAWATISATGTVPAGSGWMLVVLVSADVGAVMEFDSISVTQSGFNLIGIYSDFAAFSATGGLDGAGRALSANLLGSRITFDGTPYDIGAPNVPNVLQCLGQTVNLPAGAYQSIWFLAVAVGPVNGQQNQNFVVSFTDGTTQTLKQSSSSWVVPQNYQGEFPAFNGLPYRNKYDGTKDTTQTCFVYSFSKNLTPGKTVAAITLPNNANLMILAISLDVDSTSYNFELFSYRDAILSGADQYQLTPLHRGLYGTQNLAHTTGESFVRLDQASVRYPYNASYVGKTIYFKFCSFNTMGGHLLQLADVAPISFTLEGSGPGSIDALTGAFLPGLDQVPNGSYVFQRTAAHSSYRPTSNPLTGHDAGSSATINVAAFFMRSPTFPDVALSSGAITNLSYGTLYYVYYLDMYFLGGAVAYLVSTTKETVLQNAAAFFVGSIRTPLAGGPDTIGNNDGGAGAQQGSTTRILFTTVASVVGAVANPPNIIDGDSSTFAQFSVSAPPNAGPNTGTGADTFFPAGNPNWATPTNISGNPASWTTTSVPVNNGSSILNCTNFGFSIPAGATVLGIRVDWAGAVGFNYGNHSWIGLGLVKGGVHQGFGGPIYMNQTVATAYAQGNELDTMGISFSPADINASNFGVYIQAFNDSGAGGAQTFLLGTLVVKVYYALVSNQQVMVQTIPAPTQSYSSMKMKVAYAIPTNTLNGTGARATFTFIAGGTTLGTVNWNAGQTTPMRTDSFDCPVNASPTSFQLTVAVFSSLGSSVGTITVNVYDAWVEGST